MGQFIQTGDYTFQDGNDDGWITLSDLESGDKVFDAKSGVELSYSQILERDSKLFDPKIIAKTEEEARAFLEKIEPSVALGFLRTPPPVTSGTRMSIRAKGGLAAMVVLGGAYLVSKFLQNDKVDPELQLYDPKTFWIGDFPPNEGDEFTIYPEGPESPEELGGESEGLPWLSDIRASDVGEEADGDNDEVTLADLDDVDVDSSVFDEVEIDLDTSPAFVEGLALDTEEANQAYADAWKLLGKVWESTGYDFHSQQFKEGREGQLSAEDYERAGDLCLEAARLFEVGNHFEALMGYQHAANYYRLAGNDEKLNVALRNQCQYANEDACIELGEFEVAIDSMERQLVENGFQNSRSEESLVHNREELTKIAELHLKAGRPREAIELMIQIAEAHRNAVKRIGISARAITEILHALRSEPSKVLTLKDILRITTIYMNPVQAEINAHTWDFYDVSHQIVEHCEVITGLMERVTEIADAHSSSGEFSEAATELIEFATERSAQYTSIRDSLPPPERLDMDPTVEALMKGEDPFK